MMFINRLNDNNNSNPINRFLKFGQSEKKDSSPTNVKRQNTVGQTHFTFSPIPKKDPVKRRSLDVKRKESDQESLKEFVKPLQQEKQVEGLKNKVKKIKEPKKDEVSEEISLSKSLKNELKGLLNKLSSPFKKEPLLPFPGSRGSSPGNSMFDSKQYPKNMLNLNLDTPVKQDKDDIQVVSLDDFIIYEEVDSPNRLKKPETKTGDSEAQARDFREIPKTVEATITKSIEKDSNMDSFRKKRITSIATIESPTLDRSYAGYILNFMSIFTVPEIQESFLEHLQREANQEVLEFLLQVEKIQVCDSQEEQVKLFYEIVETYLYPDALKELNLEGKVKNELLQKLEGQDQSKWEFNETPYEMIKVLKNNILQDIKFDIWPRYIASDEGYEKISKHVNNPNVMSKNPSSAVLFKFQKNFGVSIDFPEAQKMADNLAYPHLLRQTYLDLKWKDKFIIDEDEDEEEDYSWDENIKIKIIIVGKKHFYKNGKFSIFTHIKTHKETEVFHTALMIGHLLFEWDENEICIPKKSLSKEALMSTDLETTLPLKNLNVQLVKLSETIVNWNVSRAFHLTEKKQFGNSQDFVDSLLESIGINQINVPTPIQQFLTQIREKGNSELEFKPSVEFQRKFKLKKITQFNSHQELDEFTSKLLDIDIELPKNHPDEFTILKSFDRGFWMRHVLAKKQIQKNSQKLIDLQKEKFVKAVKGMQLDVENITKEIKQFEKDQKVFIQESLKFEPCLSKLESSCPFCDPRRTNSFLYQ